MRNTLRIIKRYAMIAAGAALFGLGFNYFLLPNGLNAGGISGISMVAVKLLGFGSVGMFTAVANLPLFLFAGKKLGKEFLISSFCGMMFSAFFIDGFSSLKSSLDDPLLGALYGGLLCGVGLGMVFFEGATTGGSDIIVRLIKCKKPDIPIGMITIFFDLAVSILTGIVFHDVRRTLYSAVAIYITGRVIDAVVYRFDYSRTAFIISNRYAQIADSIAQRLSRGVTYLQAEGYFSGRNTNVILTAVKRQQLQELKALVVEIDPDAFVIVHDAHQVLGDGFLRYLKDSKTAGGAT